MEENKNLGMDGIQEQEEKSAIDFQLIYSTVILNWKWFVLSLIVCLGLGYIFPFKKPFAKAVLVELAKDIWKPIEGYGVKGNIFRSKLERSFLRNCSVFC